MLLDSIIQNLNVCSPHAFFTVEFIRLYNKKAVIELSIFNWLSLHVCKDPK